MITLNLMSGLLYGEVYVLLFPNGKKYVGQTTLGADAKKRANSHVF